MRQKQKTQPTFCQIYGFISCLVPPRKSSSLETCEKWCRSNLSRRKSSRQLLQNKGFVSAEVAMWFYRQQRSFRTFLLDPRVPKIRWCYRRLALRLITARCCSHIAQRWGGLHEYLVRFFSTHTRGIPPNKWPNKLESPLSFAPCGGWGSLPIRLALFGKVNCHQKSRHVTVICKTQEA